MNSRTLKNLNHFVGRVCSVFTHSIPREFDELRSREHFVIRVLEISPDGIWGEHPYNGMKSFFFTNHIQFIQEEVELDPNNPDHKKMIEEYEDRTGEKLVGDLKRPEQEPSKKMELPVLDVQEVPYEKSPYEEGDSVFVDIDSLSTLADETKKRWEQFAQQRALILN